MCGCGWRRGGRGDKQTVLSSRKPAPPLLSNLPRVTASSALLSFVFVFGNSLRGVYESVVFLFVIHPFDVGDTIAVGPGVGTGGGERCVVEEIALLTTTLRRLGDGATVAWPNAALAAAPLVNVSRSGPRAESMKVLVDAGAVVAGVAGVAGGGGGGGGTSLVEEVEAAAGAVVSGSPLDFTGEFAVSVSPGEGEGGGSLGPKLAVSVWWKFSYNGESEKLNKKWRERFGWMDERGLSLFLFLSS